MTTQLDPVALAIGDLRGDQKLILARLDDLCPRVAGIEKSLIETVHPELAASRKFRGRVGQVVIAAGSLAAAGVGLIWHGIASYWADILGLAAAFTQGHKS